MSEVDVIGLVCDHGGYKLKEEIKRYLSDRYQILDLGTSSEESVDYPEFGYAIADAIATGKISRGIAICGSGVGISIAANRNKAVRCALCTDSTMARLTRQHNDANVLALGARIIGIEVALECVEVFLTTEFEGGRHERRVNQL